MSNSCILITDLPVSEQRFLQVGGYVQSIISSFFIPLSMVGLLESILSLITIIMLRKWKNPAKIYYVLIIALNCLSSIYIDMILELRSIVLDVTIKFLGPANRIRLPLVLHMNIVFCKVGTFLQVLLPLEQSWTLVLLNLHRMFILLFPLKAAYIEGIFCKRNIILFLTVISLFVSHHLHTAFFPEGREVCNNYVQFTVGETFWRDYDTYVSLTVQTLIPWCILVGSILIIVCKLWIHSRSRAALVRGGRQIDYTGVKILLALSGAYFLALVPYHLCEIIKSLLSNCRDKNVVMYSFISGINSTVLKKLWIILRILDPIIFYFTIPQFKSSIRKIICLKFRNGQS